jgi:hypothetical protein
MACITRISQERTKKMVWQLLRIFCVLAIIGGLLLSVYTYNFKSGLTEAQGWPTTEGKVLSYEKNYKSISGTDRYGNKTTTAIYRPEVQYEYEVNGKKYTNSRIKYVDEKVVDSINMSDISAILSSFYSRSKKEEVKLKVFYNPDNPQESLLLPIYNQVTINVGIYGGIGLTFLSFLFLIMVNASIPKD